MQIDFHHAVTYVVARLAGINHGEAETLAYCAQYVDDATNEGEIRFDNDALYRRLASAHKMLDYRNFNALANHLVWIPFHFLPGNGRLSAGNNPQGTFIEKLICRPNSYVAQDMVRACILDRNKPYGLHRLGITAHVFIDTWAHQGFAGVNNAVNEVHDLRWGAGRGQRDEIFEQGRRDFLSGANEGFFARIKNRIGDFFREAVPPLGHGPALSYPDRPYAVWSYTNGLEERVQRNNPDDFTEAADELCKVFRRYQLGDPDAPVNGLAPNDRDKIRRMLTDTTIPEGDERHKVWLGAIAGDDFGFGAQQLDYIPKGVGSWKHQAVRTEKETDEEDDVFTYEPAFLTSNWKMFHDAAKAHRLSIIDDILPRYGICAA